MIHIGLHGDDRVLGMTISLPQVPSKGDNLRVGDVVYLISAVTWLAGPNFPVTAVLELELQHHVS